MRLIDLYFRAFQAYKKLTQLNNQSEKDRLTIAHANHKHDILTAIKFNCTIESDWVLNIDEGLKYIEKAILEDRQFIRTEGNVVEIEKVKKTSKATVEHLSRHSELITRVPKKGENLIPDKLYIVEKLSDYTVYENRFLYMLLSYLKDFIQMRIDKIKDKVTTYESYVNIHKDIKTNDAHIHYKLDYDAVHKNDPYLTDRYHHIPLMHKVENIYALVNAFLATPLMKEVAKAPMIKPPIVKTNVLLMNQNFRAAVALYEFVRSYNKDGYTFEEDKTVLQPFPGDLADDVAHIIELTGAVSYTFGQDIKHDLISKLEKEENDLKQKEKLKTQNELRRLKKVLAELNEDPTTYIQKLEKYQMELERENNALIIENNRISDLEENVQSLKLDNEKLTLTNIDLLDQVEEHIQINETFKQQYFDDFKKAEDIHRHELTNLEDKMAQALQNLELEKQRAIQSLKLEHEAQIDSLNETHKITLEAAQNHLNQIIACLEIRIQGLDEEIKLLELRYQETLTTHQSLTNELNQEIKDLELKIQMLTDEKNASRAQYVAIKAQAGLTTDDEQFTSKDKFKQLETEMRAYKKFFKAQWALTKQHIKDKVKKEVSDIQEPEDKNNLSN